MVLLWTLTLGTTGPNGNMASQEKPDKTYMNGDNMTDEQFILHVGGMINTLRDHVNDSVQSIMELIANRLNEKQRSAITPEYIALLEKRITNLENK